MFLVLEIPYESNVDTEVEREIDEMLSHCRLICPGKLIRETEKVRAVHLKTHAFEMKFLS